MNLAKISQNGQITIPSEVRKDLGLKSGDKILFYKNKAGETVVSNASLNAISRAQLAFIGAANELGLKDDSEVQALINEERYGKNG